MNIVLTGATGLLGRNLLFEFIKKYLDRLDDLRIIVLGRKGTGLTLSDRIDKIILDDGLAYIGSQHQDRIKEFARSNIDCVEMDLAGTELAISIGDLSRLNAQSIDFFFHIASLTDFRDSDSVKKALWESNVQGTERILNLVKQLDVQEFCYVSSAYCCGHTAGEIMPDYINLQQEFRNPYELSKLQAEIITRNFAKDTGIRYRCFRPSTISGRLLEAPLGTIHKFDVFYGWALFWLHSKLRRIDDIDRRYIDYVSLDARIYLSSHSGLNIVPVDYVAKVMYQVCTQNDPGESYHLVNNEETPHVLYLSLVLEVLKVKGVVFVDEMPVQLNELEKFYYKTVGKIFTNYFLSEPILFDVTNLSGVLAQANLVCPTVDQRNFGILMDFAVKQDLGIDLNKFTGGRAESRWL